jgi:hypothetical protein
MTLLLHENPRSHPLNSTTACNRRWEDSTLLELHTITARHSPKEMAAAASDWLPADIYVFTKM